MGAYHQRETANEGGLLPGWRRTQVPMLGARSRVGGVHFRLGRGSHIRAVDLPGGGQALMVANELHDVRLYTALGSDTPVSAAPRLLGRPGPDDTYPLGYSGHPTPKCHYAAARPSGDSGAWHLVVGSLTGPACLLQYDRVPHAVGHELFHWPRTLLPVHGIPEFVSLGRDDRHALILGRADGTLSLVPASAGDPSGLALAEQVPLAPAKGFAYGLDAEAHRATGLAAPFEFPGPAFPCRVAWEDEGRSDLLVGTGDGHVVLLRDIGSGDRVAYDRGRRLSADDGLVHVTGPACPTVMETEEGRSLLVLDGEGVLWRWPIELRDCW